MELLPGLLATKRPADAPSGLCPACLLKAGLLGEGPNCHDVTITFGPASSSVLASFGEAFGKIPPVLLRDADSITDPGPVIRPSSSEIPDPPIARRGCSSSARSLAAAWGPCSRAATRTSAATWP